jgi:hypothetical protein
MWFADVFAEVFFGEFDGFGQPECGDPVGELSLMLFGECCDLS